MPIHLMFHITYNMTIHLSDRRGYLTDAVCTGCVCLCLCLSRHTTVCAYSRDCMSVRTHQLRMLMSVRTHLLQVGGRDGVVKYD